MIIGGYGRSAVFSTAAQNERILGVQDCATTTLNCISHALPLCEQIFCVVNPCKLARHEGYFWFTLELSSAIVSGFFFILNEGSQLSFYLMTVFYENKSPHNVSIFEEFFKNRVSFFQRKQYCYQLKNINMSSEILISTFITQA